METLVKGDVVVLPFPFSDLSASKNRPALVVATLIGEDVILCQITSVLRADEYILALSDNDFKQGALRIESRIKCNRLFTADKSIISYKLGSLKESKIKEVERKLIKIFTQ
ncbi:MAG: type II toxin-antitoxin system PemK/MazF family toxin [Candidatus Micrarchaeota archaeon]|nr:type II toxin-antitoxin system PemK/MazF family toxin [Candidatus Micrarchaeota archaeon]